MKSSSTMKVVDQESIRQRNSNPINRRDSEQSAQTFKVSWQKTKKNPISTKKKFKQYQVSAVEPQLKVATQKRS